MSFSYSSPANSFVQFPCVDESFACAPEYPVCLPIMLESDVRFEVNVETDEMFALFARIVPSCSTLLPAVTDDLVQAQFTTIDLSKGRELRDKNYLCTLNNLFQDDIDALQCNQCCYIQLWKRKYTLDIINPFHDTLLACSCCFVKICDPCFTSVLSYRCNENAFGFLYYVTDPTSYTPTANLIPNYYNVIRLPFYLKEPQFPAKRNVFVKSDGSRKTLSARVEKQYQVDTDWWPQRWQQCLVMAVEHDTMKIENVNAGIVPAQQFTCESTPEQKYNERLNFPLARTEFKINLTPFNAFNSNCK